MNPADASGTVEVWRGRDRLWRYRFLHPAGTVIWSNRSFLTREEAEGSAELAYPEVPLVELSEPPRGHSTSHPWRKLAIATVITAGTGWVAARTVRLILLVRRAARRTKQVGSVVAAAANLRRRDRS